MTSDQLQEQCELGQQELMRLNYLEAERILVAAEREAWTVRDFDTLARLYMPLQEARRQRRQRCGEGMVCLDLIAQGPNDRLEGRHVVENYPFGQLLVAGWATLEPARAVRRLQQQFGLYVETFLGAVYAGESGRLVVIAPLSDTPLPRAGAHSAIALRDALPPHCLLLREEELPRGSQRGTAATYADVMALWERLHAPFLAAAERQGDPIKRIEAFRRTIEVDNACELAHQELADVARQLARESRGASARAGPGDRRP